MKKKSLFLSSATLLLAMGCLGACSLNKDSLVIWVGSESVAFYRKASKQFLKDNPDFGLKLTIVGADTGGAAGQMVSDNTACGDIVTIANDNIGKLSELSYITPIIDQETIDQIEADNPQSFIKVIKNYLGNDTDHPYYFAVPYISQALFLYYDTRYVTAEQAESFEGLIEAAKAYDKANGVTGTKSFAVTGTDGFNYSFPLLARNLSTEAESGGTSKLRIYEEGKQKDCYNQSNDAVAVARYMQRNLANPNGALLDLKGSAWSSYIENHACLSLIGGAWHYNSFKDAVTSKDGKTYMGCARIPTFTLTAADVEGIEDVNYPDDPSLPENLRGVVDPAPKAGTKFRGGSYVDCKSFVINMASLNGDPEKYYKSCKLLRYFASKEVQNASFVEALNVPAYVGSEDFIESVKDQVEESAYYMAKAQTGMSQFGIAQPFTNGKFNTYYYQNKAPDEYTNMVKNLNGKYDSLQSIRETLFTMEYIWKNGGAPNKSASGYPTSFPADTTTKYN